MQFLRADYPARMQLFLTEDNDWMEFDDFCDQFNQFNIDGRAGYFKVTVWWKCEGETNYKEAVINETLECTMGPSVRAPNMQLPNINRK